MISHNGVTSVTDVKACHIILILNVFLADTPLCVVHMGKCYKGLGCYIQTHLGLVFIDL